MTPKQELFVKHYLTELNGTQAAINAGYSEKCAAEIASENLTKPNIKAAIQKELDARAEKVGINAEYVLSTIQDTIERCKQAKPVLDKKGQLILSETEEGKMLPTYTFDSNAVLKGCDLLGKHLKLFTDKVEHSGVDGKDLLPDADSLDTRLRIAYLLAVEPDTEH